MERRVLLAVVLSIGLIYLVQVLFPTALPPTSQPAADTAAVDSAGAFDGARAGEAAGRDEGRPPPDLRGDGPAPPAGQRADTGAGAADTADAPGRGVVPRLPDGTAGAEETIVVRSELFEFAFSTRGATLVGARLLAFDSYAEDDEEGEPVELVPNGERFLKFGIAIGGDTVRVDDLEFTPSADEITLGRGGSRDSLTFTHEFPGAAGSSARFVVTYRFQPDAYLLDVEGRVEGLEERGYVLLNEFASQLRSNEKNFDEDRGQFALVTNGQESDVANVKFGNIESGDVRAASGGPFHWVAVKSKYFLVAAVAPADGPLFGGAAVRGTGAEGEARVSTSMPVPAGSGGFRFGLYAGPQDYGRLDAIGQDLQDVNSFGYEWLQPVFRPLVAIVMPILVWMHTRLDLAYGWVLILFGVLMRVVLFPLYQKSMRAQIGQMRLQPIVQDIRERHKDDPQKMQQEMMRVYREEGVNPFAGCLPMLVPMPILFTLFFVFQGTIEFRGVPFLWLPDLSLKDPLYIIPVVMGLSMFLLQWIGQRSMSQTNTQMKAMMYGMPLVLTFLFANFPSGLNLYYTTSNLASLPQQLYVARERKAAGLHKDPGERREDPGGDG